MRGQRHASASPYPQKDPVPIVQEAGWASGPVWTGVENLAPHRDSILGPSSPQAVAIPTTLPGPRGPEVLLWNSRHPIITGIPLLSVSPLS